MLKYIVSPVCLSVRVSGMCPSWPDTRRCWAAEWRPCTRLSMEASWLGKAPRTPPTWPSWATAWSGETGRWAKVKSTACFVCLLKQRCFGGKHVQPVAQLLDWELAAPADCLVPLVCIKQEKCDVFMAFFFNTVEKKKIFLLFKHKFKPNSGTIGVQEFTVRLWLNSNLSDVCTVSQTEQGKPDKERFVLFCLL